MNYLKYGNLSDRLGCEWLLVTVMMLYFPVLHTLQWRAACVRRLGRAANGGVGYSPSQADS